MKKVLIYFTFIFSINFYSQQKKIDSLKNLLPTLTDTLLVNGLDEISWEYKYINMDSAFAYSNKALVVAKKINNQKSIANSYNTIGSNFEYISKLDSALYYYKQSLVYKNKLRDSIGIANTLNNIGIVYDEQGDYVQSLNNYFQALRIYENNESSFDKIPMVLVNIGIVYKKQKEYDKVFEYYEKALKIYEENKYDVGIVITTGNIGSTLLKLKKYDESIKFSAKAKKMYDSLGYKRYVPYMDIQIANAYDSLRKFEKSQPLYKTAIKSFRAEKNYYEIADAKIGLANNYLKTNNYKSSLIESKESINISEKNGFDELKLRALKINSKANYKLKNLDDAFTNLMNYSVLKDSIFEKEKAKSITEIETKYQTEKKEKELLKTRTEKAETELELSKTRGWIYVLVGGLLILFILFFAINQRNKRKAQELITQEKERGFKAIIDAQEQERSKIARELHDGVVQQIGSVILKSRNLFSDKNLEDDKEAADVLQKLENSNKDLRNISHQMMPIALKELGIIPALEDLLEGSLGYTKIKYSVEHFNIASRLPEKIEITIYRITQELINNIIKHSKATEVSVQLFKNQDNILLIVEDNGIGFSKKNSSKGIGLLNITSRLDMVNGNVNFEPSPNSGTLVTIKIPYEDAN